jgi:hypothetical protein
MLDDKTCNEIDKATSLVSKMNDIDWYVELLRIKNAKDRDAEIDFAIACSELKLKVWGIEPENYKKIFNP